MSSERIDELFATRENFDDQMPATHRRDVVHSCGGCCGGADSCACKKELNTVVIVVWSYQLLSPFLTAAWCIFFCCSHQSFLLPVPVSSCKTYDWLVMILVERGHQFDWLFILSQFGEFCVFVSLFLLFLFLFLLFNLFLFLVMEGNNSSSSASGDEGTESSSSTSDAENQCHICGASFPDSSRLGRHKQIHGDRFPCGCGLDYATLDGLRKHRKRKNCPGRPKGDGLPRQPQVVSSLFSPRDCFFSISMIWWFPSS